MRLHPRSMGPKEDLRTSGSDRWLRPMSTRPSNVTAPPTSFSPVPPDWEGHQGQLEIGGGVALRRRADCLATALHAAATHVTRHRRIDICCALVSTPGFANVQSRRQLACVPSAAHSGPRPWSDRTFRFPGLQGRQDWEGGRDGMVEWGHRSGCQKASVMDAPPPGMCCSSSIFFRQGNGA